LLYILIWILPCFGRCYEKSAEKKDRAKYQPSEEDLIVWSG
jgi:hypothetical protein